MDLPERNKGITFFADVLDNDYPVVLRVEMTSYVLNAVRHGGRFANSALGFDKKESRV